MNGLKTLKQTTRFYTFLFMLIPLTCYGIALLIPFLSGNVIAFMEWDGIKNTKAFVGFDNYIQAFNDAHFWKTMWFSGRFAFFSVISVNFMALFLALFLNTKIKSKNALRLLLFMPMLIGNLLVGYIWKFNIGTIFPIIGEITGMEIFVRNWFGNRQLTFVALLLVSTWRSMGYFMLIYLAALQSVPAELIESSMIDGAKLFRRIWSIYLPLIAHAFTICFFLSLLNAMLMFDYIAVLTQGGPVRSTETVVWNIYQEGFNAYNFGLGTAKSMIFFVIVVTFSIIQISIMRRKEVEL